MNARPALCYLCAQLQDELIQNAAKINPAIIVVLHGGAIIATVLWPDAEGSRLYKTQMPIKEMGIFWSALIAPNASQSFSRWAEYYPPLSFV